MESRDMDYSLIFLNPSNTNTTTPITTSPTHIIIRITTSQLI
jgi:hypothetical protein